jgi:hypothetical protein
MSLASRLANLFSGSPIATEEDHNTFGFQDDGRSKDSTAFTGVRSSKRGTRPNTMAPEEAEEEEARPPYLHVSFI